MVKAKWITTFANGCTMVQPYIMTHPHEQKFY